jgi:hypothetical protein
MENKKTRIEMISVTHGWSIRTTGWLAGVYLVQLRWRSQEKELI